MEWERNMKDSDDKFLHHSVTVRGGIEIHADGTVAADVDIAAHYSSAPEVGHHVEKRKVRFKWDTATYAMLAAEVKTQVAAATNSVKL